MRFISAENLKQLMADLHGEGRKIWAPRVAGDSNDTVLFMPWNPGDDLEVDRKAALSPKEALLPRSEPILKFHYAGGPPAGIEIDEIIPDQMAVLVASRACDSAALASLDPVFDGVAGGYRDPHYCSRRAQLTVITLGCLTGDRGCFCSSFDAGSANKRGSDIFLYPIEGGYLAEACSEKGGELMSSTLFSQTEAQPPRLAQTAKVDLTGIGDALKALFSDIAFWQEVSGRCLSCGVCAFGCSACHCFNISDEMSDDCEGERLRSWDSCMFQLYTQEASGHNPRATIAHRYRNRLSHKFWYFGRAHDGFLCHGCGRCIRGCPAGIDIRQVLEAARLRAAGQGGDSLPTAQPNLQTRIEARE